MAPMATSIWPISSFDFVSIPDPRSPAEMAPRTSRALTTGRTTLRVIHTGRATATTAITQRIAAMLSAMILRACDAERRTASSARLPRSAVSFSRSLVGSRSIPFTA